MSSSPPGQRKLERNLGHDAKFKRACPYLLQDFGEIRKHLSPGKPSRALLWRRQKLKRLRSSTEKDAWSAPTTRSKWTAATSLTTLMHEVQIEASHLSSVDVHWTCGVTSDPSTHVGGHVQALPTWPRGFAWAWVPCCGPCV